MNGRIFFWSLTSALAGFLFGFDTVVISGAEKTIQSLWGLSPGLHGIAMASALYGTVVGSLLGGWPADRFGRKATLLWIGILYFVGAVGSGLAPNVDVFIAARVIGGLGIGISTVVAPHVHLRDCAAQASRTPRRHVPVQHCFRHPDRFCVERAARRHRRKCLALDAGRRRVSLAALCAVLLRPARKPALAAEPEGRPRGGTASSCSASNPNAHEAEIAAEADEIAAASSEQSSSGHFWTRRLRKADPARHPDRFLQPALRHQCDSLFRAAHL